MKVRDKLNDSEFRTSCNKVITIAVTVPVILFIALHITAIVSHSVHWPNDSSYYCYNRTRIGYSEGCAYFWTASTSALAITTPTTITQHEAVVGSGHVSWNKQLRREQKESEKKGASEELRKC